MTDRRGSREIPRGLKKDWRKLDEARRDQDWTGFLAERTGHLPTVVQGQRRRARYLAWGVKGGPMRTWRVWIESEPVDPESWSDRVDVLLDVLADSQGIEGPVGWGSGSVLGAVFEVAAPTAAEASQIGVGAFVAALGKAAGDIEFGMGGIVRLEVAPADFEPEALLGATDIARLLGVSRQRVYQLAEQAGFPSPAAELARGAVWRRRDVEAWLASRIHPRKASARA